MWMLQIAHRQSIFYLGELTSTDETKGTCCYLTLDASPYRCRCVVCEFVNGIESYDPSFANKATQIDGFFPGVQNGHHLSYSSEIAFKDFLELCAASCGLLDNNAVLVVYKEAHEKEDLVD